MIETKPNSPNLENDPLAQIKKADQKLPAELLELKTKIREQWGAVFEDLFKQINNTEAEAYTDIMVNEDGIEFQQRGAPGFMDADNAPLFFFNMKHRDYDREDVNIVFEAHLDYFIAEKQEGII